MVVICIFTLLGWATDLKTVTDDVVRKRVLRTGDGTHPYSIEAKKKNLALEDDAKNNNEGERDLDHFWGWVSFQEALGRCSMMWITNTIFFFNRVTRT